MLIRYADDMVVLCHTRERAEQIKARLAEWLTPRGLSFNEDKTQIVHLAERVRLSGVQRPPLPLQAADQTEQGGHQAGPGKARGRDARAARIERGRRSSPGSTRSSGDGPPITGVWCRPRCSTRWITRCGNSPTSGPTWRHNNKPKPWIVDRYFGKHNKFRNDRWVFGDPDNNAYLVKFSWTDIVRHVMVTGAASPDDPALTDYWAKRRRKVKPPLDNYTLRLLTRQGEAQSRFCWSWAGFGVLPQAEDGE